METTDELFTEAKLYSFESDPYPEPIQEATIDKTWLQSVSALWSAWSDKVQTYPGRVSVSPKTKSDLGIFTGNTNAALLYLREGIQLLKRLQGDVLVNKGYLQDTFSERGEEIQKLLEDALEDLEIAEESIRDAVSEVEELPLSTLSKQLDHEYFTDFKDLLDSIHEDVVVGVEKADKRISKLLKIFALLVAKSKGSLERDEVEPDTVTLGNTTVVFNPDGDYNSVIPPAIRKPMLLRLNQLEKRLSSLGLKKLWYGTLVIHPYHKHHSPHKKGVLAVYRRGEDTLAIYSRNLSSFNQSVAHELGHRYWFRFMRQPQRAKYSELFGKVQAVSEYGSTMPEEDFAETFAHYVTGEDLTQDQSERLQAVLGSKGPQSESLSRIVSKIRMVFQ